MMQLLMVVQKVQTLCSVDADTVMTKAGNTEITVTTQYEALTVRMR